MALERNAGDVGTKLEMRGHLGADLGLETLPDKKYYLCMDDFDDSNNDEDEDYFFNFKHHQLEFDHLSEEHIKSIKFYGGLRHPLAISMLKILKRYPLGVTLKFFMSVFKSVHKYEIDYRELGYESFAELLTKNNNIFTVLESRWKDLIFPSFFPAPVKIDQGVGPIHKNIFRLLFNWLTIEKVPLPVMKATEHLNDMFGIGLNLQAWEFEEFSFYQNLVGMWGSGCVEIVASSSPYTIVPSKITYVIQLVTVKRNLPNPYELMTGDDDYLLMSPYLLPIEESEKKNVKSIKTNISRPTLLTGCELSGFKTNLFNLESVGDSLKSGSHYIACADLMIHPCHFFVALFDQEQRKNTFIRYMHETYEKWQSDKSLTENMKIEEQDAQIGLYVAVKYEKEWLRAKIVSKNENEYKLLMVDLGVYGVNIKLQDIKYLHSDFVNFPQQSFSCRLQLGILQQGFGKEDVNNGIWTENQRNVFYEELHNNCFGITPLERIMMRRGIVWEINIFLIDGPTTRRTICPNLAQHLVHIYWPNVDPTPLFVVEGQEQPVVLQESLDEEIVY